MARVMTTDLSHLEPEWVRTTVEDALTNDYPRFSEFVLGVESAPLQIPALTGFEFHAPFGRIRLAQQLCDSQKRFEVVNVVFHQLAHFAQQVRRFRRRDRLGVMQDLHIGGSSVRYFPWQDVESSLGCPPSPLSVDQRKILELHAGPCAKCGRPAAELEWVYFISPPWTWGKLCGQAGWMAVCRRCPEQVAFFAQRVN